MNIGYFIVGLQLMLLGICIWKLRKLTGVSTGRKVPLAALAAFGPGSLLTLWFIHRHEQGKIDLNKSLGFFDPTNNRFK